MHHLEKDSTSSELENNFKSDFEKDVFSGLNSTPKWLSSKYFYNQKGDKIFQEIMGMKEYYLTDAEIAVFKRKKDDILSAIGHQKPFRLIELGAGDGSKTRIILEHFVNQNANFSYAPVDISGHVLEILKQNLEKHIPGLNIHPLEGDYFKVLSDLSIEDSVQNVVLFLGSNIGNFSKESAISFLRQIREHLHVNDLFLIGVDLKKDPQKILDAYNDPQGITARFNLNLLNRINEELNADFDLNGFIHYPVYDPISGECRSYLMSVKNQKVVIRKLDLKVEFAKWEPIFMEVSKKYDLKELHQLAADCGFKIQQNFLDEEFLFVDSLWKAE